MWRASLATRIGTYAVQTYVGLVAIFIILDDGQAWSLRLAISLIYAGILVAAWWIMLRPQLVADDVGLLILERRDPVRLAWADITEAEAGWSGLMIGCADGRYYHARYPQRPNSARWLGRRTQADEAVEYIMARADQARSAA